MKTAEEWIKLIAEASDKELSQDVIGCTPRGKKGREVFIMDYDITPIQLDSMKEGMRRAAEIANRLDIPDDMLRDTILTAAEQLTEKDL